MIWATIGYFLTGLVIGSTLLIGLAYMFGGSLGFLNQLLGRLIWTIGSLVNNGTCIILEHGKGYKTVPLREGTKGWEIYNDKKWVSVDGEQFLTRVGLRPFGVLAPTSRESFEDLIFKGLPGERYDSENYKMETRGGRAGFIPSKIWDKKEGVVISLSQLMNRLKLGGSTEISDAAYVESLKKYAGLDGFGSTTTQLIFFLSCLIIGSLSAWLMVG